MKHFNAVSIVAAVLLSCSLTNCNSYNNKLLSEPQKVGTQQTSTTVNETIINDSFWTPKLKLWTDVTVNDVFDKYEGGYEGKYNVSFDGVHPDLVTEYKKLGRTRNVLLNFDHVAQGKRGIDQFYSGRPAMEGFFYMAIRGASDLLTQYPNRNIEKRIDNYIDHIEAAQNFGGTGFISTYTMLVNPEIQREFGERSISNQGRLIEGAIHNYTSTGNTKFLNMAVKSANLLTKEIGLFPKKNIVTEHPGPEEVMVKLYLLFKDNPELKDKMSERVNENDYYDLAKFWVENRGYHYNRKSEGKSSQDSTSVFRLKTIEGHAVQATLLALGIAKIAKESQDPRYVKTATSWWDNMVGKRMYITGGVGAIARYEMFGPDYFLPNDGYSETCAGIGSGFYSEQMFELLGDGKYVDELERSLYNLVLGGISLSGDKYNYQNPLVGNGIKRWSWHSTPCCPPMFLKIVGELPKYIYSTGNNLIYVNLFIGSEAKIKLDDAEEVLVKQATNYPWEGRTSISIIPAIEKEFTVKVRIPGWAQSIENPFDLYSSKVKSKVGIKLNGKSMTLKLDRGYVAITRKWAKGDVIELTLPMEPRFVYANEKVENLKGLVALASGPIVYGFEAFDNPELKSLKIDINSPVKMTHKTDLLNGVNIITGNALTSKGTKVEFSAIPYSALNNRTPGNAFKVWMPY